MPEKIAINLDEEVSAARFASHPSQVKENC